jgi:histidinol-phosphate aminotransferase
MNDSSMTRRAWLGGVAATGVLPGVAMSAHEGARRPATTIRLSLNENAFGPSRAVMRAIAAEAGRLNRYVEQPEADALAVRIASFENVRADQVILGEVLEPLGLALARRRQGGGIVFSTPGYTALVDAAAPLGGRPVPVPLNAGLTNDLPALERAVGTDTLAVSLVNPHNPTGTVDDPAALGGFIARVAPRALVIVDEAYLEYDDLARRSAIGFVRAGANVLVFRTFAKIYGLAGLSIGYAVGPSALIAELRNAGVGEPHSLNRLSLAAASAALADQHHVAEVRARTVHERRRITAELDRLELPHADSRADFVFFDAGQRAAEARAAFTAAGIEIGRPFPPLDSWLRITIGTSTENEAVLAALRRAFGDGRTSATPPRA